MSVLERRSISVQGLVQGVGFRPYVYSLATRLGLAGFVRNQTTGVLIEVEGAPATVEDFLRQFRRDAPPRSRIAEVDDRPAPPLGERGFRIEPSAAAAGIPAIPPDVATCEACLAEIADPTNRRHRHALASCADCGPRFTLIEFAPFDRARTTLAGFALCARCAAEYADPQDRRFHAQTLGCPDCGPRLELYDAHGTVIACADPVAAVAQALREGRIAALKGLGGYHLACLAADEAAVARLRRLKARDEKPFAVMVADLAGAQRLATADAAERSLLCGPEAPIVLLRVRVGAPLATGIAPGLARVGVMLPSTPLQALLLRALDGAPLVMTSGNRSAEPMAFTDDDAQRQLGAIADLQLRHDRAIRTRCDDSVAFVAGGAPMLVRRARGHAPAPLALLKSLAVPTLATGGEFKASFALGEGRRAVPSHHLGDLDQAAAWDAYLDAVAHYQELFGIRPQRLVHDLHPDYATTRWAWQRADLPRLGVQHHHAHIAAVMAEHGLDGRVIGVALDGTGWGADGTAWGGEFLLAGYRGFERAMHLRQVPMPGGDAAAREVWRMGVAHLNDAGLPVDAAGLGHRIDAARLRGVAQMLERRVNSPLTSSMGRLFDAAAALAGVGDQAAFEAQAAMRLEALASTCAVDGEYPFELCGREIDTRPLIRALVADRARGAEPARIARRFHSTIAAMIAAVCGALRSSSGLDRVCLGGGVFLNALLVNDALQRLRGAGFTVFLPRQLPPGDGALGLGQLAVAAGLDSAEN